MYIINQLDVTQGGLYIENGNMKYQSVKFLKFLMIFLLATIVMVWLLFLADYSTTVKNYLSRVRIESAGNASWDLAKHLVWKTQEPIFTVITVLHVN